MIHDPLLRWVVTGLFAFAAIDCAAPLLSERLPRAAVVSQSLHVAMAIAMATMAWPWSAQLPTTGPAGCFLLATSWFAVIGVATPGLRVLYGYHSLMMLATAWMYFAMNGTALADHAGPHPGTPMPGMTMAVPDQPMNSGMPAWVGVVNRLGTIVFTVGAVFWASRSVKCRSYNNLAQLAIAVGTAALFVVMLPRI